MFMPPTARAGLVLTLCGMLGILSGCGSSPPGTDDDDQPTPTPTQATPTPTAPTPTATPPTGTPTQPPTPTPVVNPTPTPVPAPGTGYQFWTGELGPAGPLYSGKQQYPFICYTTESNLGQPLIDNYQGRGNAIFPEVDGVPDYSATPLGYSELCSMRTRVDYFYYSTSSGRFYLYDANNPPQDMQTLEIDGQLKDFLVRVETGTLNRFIYTIAMLAPLPEDLSHPSSLDNSFWNQRLIYYLRGGVNIGHWQGTGAWHGGLSGDERKAFKRMLEMGYAIATSSGNETGVHYNMMLAEETAVMVKEHFVATYGAPLYTVGIGGSGGGVQQYMFGQNAPGLLDAGIPLYAYPDMVSQTTPVGDCNLLEQYFWEDVTAKGSSSKWATWSHRPWIEGMNASDTVTNSIWGTPGSSECIEGWWFGEPLVMNPVFTAPEYYEGLKQYRYPASVIASIKWTHFNDLQNIYGVDSKGFAPIPFDNEGVQYGLKALKDGLITTAEFLEINSCVGSWEEQEDYVMWDPINDPFDVKNSTQNPTSCRQGSPAARRVGDIQAMMAAYDSGQVFSGAMEMPVIDLRPYLEPQLDMHNTRQSFAARQRMLNHDGDASNQVIWFTGSESDVIPRVEQALSVLDVYFTKDQMPVDFTDKCFSSDGRELASGPDVWAGILDDEPAGVCTQTYPIFSSSRMVAGESIAGDIFKCALKPLTTALGDGTYGALTFNSEEQAQLAKIFPTGVCDYSKPDVGRP